MFQLYKSHLSSISHYCMFCFVLLHVMCCMYVVLHSTDKNVCNEVKLRILYICNPYCFLFVFDELCFRRCSLVYVLAVSGI